LGGGPGTEKPVYRELPRCPIAAGLATTWGLTFAAMNHEEAAIKAFIRLNRQERCLRFVSNPNRRAKFTAEPAHFRDLDVKYSLHIPPNQQNPASVVKLLASMGAGSKCRVITENLDLDGREMDLDAALKETIGYGMGTIISCIPGRLAYFEDEDVRYILQRSPATK
jgi:hypothetical protein